MRGHAASEYYKCGSAEGRQTIMAARQTGTTFLNRGRFQGLYNVVIV